MGVYFRNYTIYGGKMAIIQKSDLQTFELRDIHLSLNLFFYDIPTCKMKVLSFKDVLPGGVPV